MGDTETTTDLRDAAAPEPPLASGARVGRYVIVERIGSGGMGVVYAAQDPELDRKIALKLLREDDHPSAERRARLAREAQAMAKLSHPNVVTVHDVGSVGDRLFVAMELVDGVTLRAWLAERRPWREVVAALAAAGQGLAAAHAAGIVHRDFKPDNVLVRRDGRVLVTDFGLARSRDEGPARPTGDGGGAGAAALTRTGAAMGTPAYMASEQHTGGAVDARTDQFSFCVTLYEALYGVRPFAPEPSDAVDTIDAIAMEVMLGRIRTPPRDGGVPSWIEDTVRRGLAVDPDARHASMDALLAALARDPRAARRRWIVRGVAVAALLGAGAVAAVWLYTPTPTSTPAPASATGPCAGGPAQLGAAWDKGRRADVHAAFTASGAPGADHSWKQVEGALDGYAARWLDGYRDVCTATAVRHEQTDEVHDLRSDCLDDRRRELDALTRALSHADRDAVFGAVAAASHLTPVTVCDDVTALRARERVPADPAARGRVTALAARLADIEALQSLGRYQEAAAKAQTALADARALGYRPLLAALLGRAGELADRLGDDRAAEPMLEEAVRTADEARDDRVRASASLDLAQALSGLARYDDAHRAARDAAAVLARIGDPSALHCYVDAAEAQIDGDARRFAAALPEARRFLDCAQRTFGPDSLELLSAEDTVATDLDLTGASPDEALALRRRMVEGVGRVFGKDHPRYSTALNNLAAALYQRGDLAGAQDAMQVALAIKLRVLGEHNPDVARERANIGFVLLELKRPADARAQFTQALATIEATLGPDHPSLVDTLTALAEADSQMGDRRAAVPLLERALAIARAHPEDATGRAGVELQLGQLLWDTDGDRARAHALVEDARALLASDANPEAKSNRDTADAWLAAHRAPR
jgi:tetratricopeptide (TPR) repeat protein/predicted Ser/Thr protein kinase